MRSLSDITPDHVLLRHNDTRLVLEPALGGAIREFSCGGIPVLRATPRHASDDPFQFACFPLVPYANRIARGRFVAASRAVQLRPNWGGDPYPLHGQGWRRPWEAVDVSAAEARLRFEGGGNEWPWRYRAEQQFRLGARHLSVELSLHNLSNAPMPAVLGFHPYFPTAGARLQARLPRIWMADEAALPVEEVATPITWSFEAGRRVDSLTLDHCFTEWDGTAVLTWPDHAVTLKATSCRYLHVYVPRGRDFFCLEPQTAATGALNRGNGEITPVAPGGRLALGMTISCGVP